MIVPLVFDETARLVNLLDQTLLPAQEQWLQISTPAAMAEAIRMLRVRGAPAIGIAAAYGVVLSARLPLPDFRAAVHAAASLLESARPTAVNLPSAMRRMRQLRDWKTQLATHLTSPHTAPPATATRREKRGISVRSTSAQKMSTRSPCSTPHWRGRA